MLEGLTPFQEWFASQRDIDPAVIIPGIRDMIPKSLEASAQLQALGGYLICMIVLEYLSEGEIRAARLALRHAQSELKTNRRGPFKQAMNYLWALGIIDSYDATDFQPATRTQVNDALKAVRLRKDDAMKSLLRLQGISSMPISENALRRGYLKDLGLTR